MASIPLPVTVPATDPWAAFTPVIRRGLVIALVVVACWVAFRVQRRIADVPYIDFEAFHFAAAAARHGDDIYHAGRRMYIYPPMFAALLSPLGDWPIRPAAAVWGILAAITTMATLVMFLRHARDVFGLSDLDSLGLAAAMGLAGLVWLEPIRWEFEQGQCDWLMLAGCVAMMVWADRRPALAGIALGFAINVKYIPVLFVVWLLWRRKWLAVAWSVIGAAIWALVPALVFGWDRNLAYLARATAGLAKLVGVQVADAPGEIYPLTYQFSVTLTSGAARIAEWQHWPSATVVGIVGAELLLGGAVAWLLFRRAGYDLLGRLPAGPNAAAVALIEQLGILTVMLAFSPQAHLRHMFLMLPVVLTGALFAVGDRSPAWRFAFFAYLLTGMVGLAYPFGTNGTVPGRVDWRFLGGGGASVLAMYLAIAGAVLARIRALETATVCRSEPFRLFC